MEPEKLVIGLVLEWWRTGERTRERLESLLLHFAELYGLETEQRERALAALERVTGVA